jgi:type IV pilus assembly protein PilX
VRAPRQDGGAALVCALVLMLAAMLVGVSVCRAVFASIASAGAGRERSLAHAAAEAALQDAERDIAGTAASAEPARTARFAAAGAGAFVEGCGRGGSGLGLCLATSPPAWQLQDLADPGNAALVPYGYYTGEKLATGSGLLPARPPAYLIEKIAPPGAGAALGAFYRITAIGFGSQASTRVVLQSVYRLPMPAPPAAPGAGPPAATPATPAAPETPAAPAAPAPASLPAGRLAWREIPNWPQLHAEAAE